MELTERIAASSAVSPTFSNHDMSPLSDAILGSLSTKQSVIRWLSESNPVKIHVLTVTPPTQRRITFLQTPITITPSRKFLRRGEAAVTEYFDWFERHEACTHLYCPTSVRKLNRTSARLWRRSGNRTALSNRTRSRGSTPEK